MRIYDISIPISNATVVWPGDPPVNIQALSSIANGDHANVSQIAMSVHTGTHLDAPKHFLENGQTIDQIPIKQFTGKALVMEIDPNETLITSDVLNQNPDCELLKNSKKVLFKTKNSVLWTQQPHGFIKNYVGIDDSGAEMLAELNLDLIGVDYLSIAPFSDTTRPHKILLSKGIILLEGIILSNISPGIYELVCLPLRLSGVEGAPARAILLR